MPALIGLLNVETKLRTTGERVKAERGPERLQGSPDLCVVFFRKGVAYTFSEFLGKSIHRFCALQVDKNTGLSELAEKVPDQARLAQPSCADDDHGNATFEMALNMVDLGFTVTKIVRTIISGDGKWGIGPSFHVVKLLLVYYLRYYTKSIKSFW